MRGELIEVLNALDVLIKKDGLVTTVLVVNKYLEATKYTIIGGKVYCANATNSVDIVDINIINEVLKNASQE